jgi:hypothetical protein
VASISTQDIDCNPMIGLGQDRLMTTVVHFTVTGADILLWKISEIGENRVMSGRFGFLTTDPTSPGNMIAASLTGIIEDSYINRISDQDLWIRN